MVKAILLHNCWTADSVTAPPVSFKSTNVRSWNFQSTVVASKPDFTTLNLEAINFVDSFLWRPRQIMRPVSWAHVPLAKTEIGIVSSIGENRYLAVVLALPAKKWKTTINKRTLGNWCAFLFSRHESVHKTRGGALIAFFYFLDVRWRPHCVLRRITCQSTSWLYYLDYPYN